SSFIIKLSIAATALSVAAMILTLCFVNGFQTTVSKKVFGFWGHLRVQQIENSKSIVATEMPIRTNDTVVQIIQNQPNIQSVQSFATKPGIIEKNKEIEGILLKGVAKNNNTKNIIQPFIVEGRWIQYNDTSYSKEIVVPVPIAQLLQIHVADTIKVYFVSTDEDGVKTYRKLVVVGIYKTGIEEFDKLFALTDLALIQRVNNWQANEIGGYEIFLNNEQQLETTNAMLHNQLPTEWMSRTVKEIYPNIFDWLNIQNVNRDVVFAIMAIVATINLITCLIILVLERTKMVGILKSIGLSNWQIQKIFLYYAGLITTIGITLGCIIGLGICYVQIQTHFITLDESAYYVNYAPISIIWWQIVVVCLSTAFVCFAALTIPSLVVKNMQPVKSIHFR
ncbi:MAG: ABC transporter permease, partial [Chitinophagaceae bacterium]